MNYHPQGLYVWDSWYLYLEGKLHCFHLQKLRPGSTPGGVMEGEFSREDGAIGHAVSEDLLKWETLPTALYSGIDGSYDDMDLWTGCCIYNEGIFYLYYTARSSHERGTINRVALATSSDGIHWDRHKKNPLITPDSRWYYSESNPRIHNRELWPIVDCRDLCVIEDPEGRGFWGYFAARQPGSEIALTAVIGLCHSTDLVTWEQYPPCFVPEKYACVEVPDVFFLNGRWYMICMTGNGYGQRNRVSEQNLTGLVSIYAVADQPEGPYTELDNNVLIGAEHNQGFCARTVEIERERYLFYTQAEQLSGSNLGTVSLPKVLRTDETGHLFACWSDKIEKSFCEPLINASQLRIVRNNGFWGSVCTVDHLEKGFRCGCRKDWAVCILESWGHNFLYSANILIEDARSAGLIFRVRGNTIYEGSYIIILDPAVNQVIFTQPVDFPRIESREWELRHGVTYNLKVTAVDAIINVFIDDILVIQLYHPAISGGKFGFFVEQGTAFFSDIKAIRIDENINIHQEA